jgi:hypothetical protein
LNPASWLTCTVTDSTLLTLTADPTGLTSSREPVNVQVTATGTLAQLGTISCTVAAPASCVVSQSAGQLTLQVNPTGLAAGRDVWVVTVSAPHASNGSVTITLVLDVS